MREPPRRPGSRHPVGDHLCETYGFTRCSGPSLEVVDGHYTGATLDSWDEYAKRDFAARVADWLDRKDGASRADRSR